MQENKTMDSIHRGLLKKYHTLCSHLGLSEEEKRAICEGCGVESSRDIDTHALIDICAKLSAQLEPELTALRRRAMAAIGAYLRSEGKAEGAALIKGIACRATGYAAFHEIPKERLRNLVYLFNKRVADAQSVQHLTQSARVPDNASIQFPPGFQTGDA